MAITSAAKRVPALRAAARLVDTGRDPTVFVKDLEAHARDLMIVQTLGEVPVELQITAERTGRSVEQVDRDSVRDRWFTADEARDYGLVDAVLTDTHAVTPSRHGTALGLAGTGEARR